MDHYIKHLIYPKNLKNLFWELEDVYKNTFNTIYKGLDNKYKEEYPNSKIIHFNLIPDSYSNECVLDAIISKDGSIKDVYKEDEVIWIGRNFRNEVYSDMDESFKRAFDIMGFILNFVDFTYGVFSKKNTYHINVSRIFNPPSKKVRISDGYDGYDAKTLQIQKNMLLDRDLDIVFANLDPNDSLYVRDSDYYKHYTKLKELSTFLTNYREQFSKERLFDSLGNLKPEYRGVSLREFNLKNIDFDNKCLAYINLSDNPEVDINFDRIQKDIHGANFNGYKLNGYLLSGFNIMDTDLRNTGATIDLATCSYTLPGKMANGTLFDENNKFVRCGNPLFPEELDAFGVKVLRKVIK